MSNKLGVPIPLPCASTKPPKSIPIGSESYQTLKKFFFDSTENSDQIQLCCDANQVENENDQLSNFIKPLFGRCPSCYHNFAKLFYELACSPEQDKYMNVNKINKSKNYIEEITYNISNDVAKRIFDSCSGLESIHLMCDIPCTMESFFNNIGSNSGFSIKFNFLRDSDGHKFKIYDCWQAPTSYSEQICSCTDCKKVCPVPQPFPGPKTYWLVFGIDGVGFVMMFLYLLIFILTAAVYVIYNVRKRKNDSKNANENDQRELRSTKLTKINEQLCQLFGQYGGLCGQPCFAIAFIIIGLIMAIILSLGLLKFDPITDPIELWTTNNSRARIEKKYFDENFGPFFRIQNVIVTPKNQKPIKQGNDQFGPVFNKTILLETFDLQQKIMNLTIEDDQGKVVQVKDICFKPMDDNACMVQSIIGWFYNNRSLIENDDYLERIKTCNSNPFSINSTGISCLAPYGGPIFPNVALADYTNNSLDAKALVFTLMLNNAINAKDNSNVMKWEKKFLELLKNYSNSNFDLAFYSEVFIYLLFLIFIYFSFISFSVQ